MIKRTLKRIFPAKFLREIRALRDWYMLQRCSVKQTRRFGRSYTKATAHNIANENVRAIYYSHQIEKGLSHSNFRYGFGVEAMHNLASSLNIIKTSGNADEENSSYEVAVSALNEYIERHRKNGVDISAVQALFDPSVWKDAVSASNSIGGSKRIHRSSKALNSPKNFEKLAEERHSVREFGPGQVSKESLIAAISLATTTPSVCNRQPARVYVSQNSKIIDNLLDHQGGFRGYHTPPALMLVTVENTVFVSPLERNEGFIDGGLFSMSLLLALENYGLAACPLNTMLTDGDEQAVRRLLGIPDSQNLIMFIAVGNYPEIAHLCKSYRFPANKITKFIY